MDEEKIKSFLTDVKPIVKKNERRRTEKEKKGDFFNIFSILRAETDEVKTHSAFLAELLNPNGTHGQRDLFLKNFLKIIAPNEDLITENAEVNIEYSIGPISEDYKSGGRLDILIRLPKSNYLILIENKIDAGDQPYQLFRYNKYAKETKCEYKLLYLTKYGHNPSETSTGKIDNEPFWECISYSQDIKNWLNKCLENIKNASPVAETIKQYIGLIDKITNQTMEIEMSEKLTELMIENLDETLAVLDNKGDFDSVIYEEFRKQMEELASEVNCDFVWDGEIWDTGRDQFLYFNPKEYLSCRIFFGKEEGHEVFYYINKSGIKKAQEKLNCFSYDPDKNYPYGWEWFEYNEWNERLS